MTSQTRLPAVVLRWIAFCGILATTSCVEPSPPLLAHELDLFRATTSWPLARAVGDGDTVDIARLLAAHGAWVNVREPRFGLTLLMWAVYTDRYASAQALLRHGADPNLRTTSHGVTALIYGADKYRTSAYVKLLLAHGADPNLRATDSLERNATPLIAAALNRLESVRLLVAAGANVNHQAPYSKSALEAALLRERVDIVRYLLVEQGADFGRPVGYTKDSVAVTVVEGLRDMMFPLDSPEHRTKMEIVRFLQAHGQNYWTTPIPARYQRQYPKAYFTRY